jgi:hypothetical protein
MYKINLISEVHSTILLITPLCLESLPLFLNSLLTWLESLLCVVVRFPSTLIPGWLYTDLPPLSSPFPFPLPQRFPISNTCPPTTTLRYRLHIVRYIYTLTICPPCAWIPIEYWLRQLLCDSNGVRLLKAYNSILILVMFGATFFINNFPIETLIVYY